MSRRKVTGSEKRRSGEILGLFGPSFGYRSAERVIGDIEGGVHHYYAREGPHDSEVRVELDAGEKRLVSTKDILSRNHLRNLPDR